MAIVNSYVSLQEGNLPDLCMYTQRILKPCKRFCDQEEPPGQGLWWHAQIEFIKKTQVAQTRRTVPLFLLASYTSNTAESLFFLISDGKQSSSARSSAQLRLGTQLKKSEYVRAVSTGCPASIVRITYVHSEEKHPSQFRCRCLTFVEFCQAFEMATHHFPVDPGSSLLYPHLT
jgi:hypothetical protein